MKNQFNKLTQGIYEMFNGPRTKDQEYDKMVEEYQKNKERLLNLKSIIENYPKRLEGYKATIENLVLSLETIFEGDKSMYTKFITDARNAHKALDEKLNNMFLRIDKLKETTGKWLEYSVTVDEKMKLREEKRKTFDHYDEKMGDIVEDRHKTLAKGKTIDEKEEEKYWRNIKKYQDAAKEYVETTNDAFKFMCYFIDSKFENVSIGLAEFLDIELIFYFEANGIFSYFKNIKRNVQAIKQSFNPPIRNYDASNFIRGKELLSFNFEDMMKNSTNISGVIKGDPNYSRRNTNENEMKRTNTHQNPYSNMNNNFNNNNNNFNNNNFNNNNKPVLLNPYTNSNQSNYNNTKFDNSIPDPFGNNNENDFKNNPFARQNSQPVQPSQPINPYSFGNNPSGDNPFDKPNV